MRSRFDVDVNQHENRQQIILLGNVFRISVRIPPIGTLPKFGGEIGMQILFTSNIPSSLIFDVKYNH